MIRTICLLFVLFSKAFAQSLPCTFQDAAGASHDLSPLTKNDVDWTIAKNTFANQVCIFLVQFSSKKDWDIWINVCRPILSTVCLNSPGSQAACQQWDKGSPLGNAGMGTASTQTTKPSSEGITLLYLKGTQDREMEINFVCGTGPGSPIFLGENPTHHYLFRWPTQYACSSSKTGLSGGSIILIILLCLVVVYLVAGILFNRFRRDLHGIEMIPNVTFWTSIPGLVKDGVMFLVGKVRGRGAYQSV